MSEDEIKKLILTVLDDKAPEAAQKAAVAALLTKVISDLSKIATAIQSGK